MDAQRTIDLRPSVASLAAACGLLARGAERAVLILRDGEPDVTLRSHSAIAPEQQFAELDDSLRAHAIPAATDARPLDLDLRNGLPER